MAQPFAQTRLLLRQQLLAALGIASAACLPACAPESHSHSHGGQDAASSGTGSTGSTGSSATGATGGGGSTGGGGNTTGGGGSTGGEPTDAGAKDAMAGHDAGAHDAAPADAGQPLDAAWSDAMVVPEPPVCSEIDPYLDVPPVENCFDRGGMEALVRYGTGMLPRDPVPTDEEVEAAFLDNGCLPMDMVADGCCNPAVSEGVPQKDGTCCYYVCSAGCCGRPFVVEGEARAAAVVRRTDWGGDAPVRDGLSARDAVAQRIAEQWLEDARMEHASIASFARFTQQLLAVGAPADLLAEATRAAADEVRHAELCFALAARYGLGDRGPGALPEAVSGVSTDRFEACLATFVEGCIGETVAAHQASIQAEHARDQVARDALREIAADEARHSELAWRFVQWIVRQHSEVLPALQAQLERAMTEAPRPEVESETAQALATLHAAGRLSVHEQRSAHVAVLRDVVAPCLTALSRDCAPRDVA